MLMLGDILAVARKSAANLDRLALSEALVARAREAAAQEAQSPASCVEDAFCRLVGVTTLAVGR